MNHLSQIFILLLLTTSIENAACDIADVLSPDVTGLSYQTKYPGTGGGSLSDSLNVQTEKFQGLEKDSGFYRKVGISPNPVESNLYIHFNEWFSGKIELGIYDISGRQVFRQLISGVPEGNIIQIDAGHLKPGLYILTIESGDVMNTFRFLKR